MGALGAEIAAYELMPYREQHIAEQTEDAHAARRVRLSFPHRPAEVVRIMGHAVIPDQPGPDAGIMAWSRHLSELEKLPQDDGAVQAAIQGARDMIAELEWVEPEGGEEV